MSLNIKKRGRKADEKRAKARELLRAAMGKIAAPKATKASDENENKFRRMLQHLDTLATGRKFVGPKGSHAVSSPSLRKGATTGSTISLSINALPEVVFKCLENGGTAAMILAHRPNIPTLTNWGPARDALLEAAQLQGLDVTEVARVFGFCEAEDRVVSSAAE